MPKKDEVAPKKEKLVPKRDEIVFSQKEGDPIPFKENWQSTYLKEVNHPPQTASQHQKVPKTVGFAEITPANYMLYIDVTENKEYNLETRKPGDFAFRLDGYKEDRTYEGYSYQPKRGGSIPTWSCGKSGWYLSKGFCIKYL